MSVGNAVGAVVGAVVGFYIGGPAGALKGAQIGMTVGGIVDPPKGPNLNGPRLTDLTMQTSSLNAVIPRAYGNIPISGNVFWLENNKLKEKKTKTESGGKGGGGSSSVTTYSYYATFAVGLCEGPIVSIRRIWVGGTLAYDSQSSNQSTIRASNKFAKYFTLYTGTDTQNPDPRMQSTLGVSNTPAYRGLAYIVFKDLPLAKYQNSLVRADVKVEVIKEGATQEDIPTSGLVLNNPAGNINTNVAWNEGCGLFMEVNQVSPGNTYQISKTGETGTWTLLTAPYRPVSNASGKVSANKERFFWRMGYDRYIYISKNGRTWTRTLSPNGPGSYTPVCDDGNTVVIFPNEYRYDCKFSTDAGKTWIYATSFAQFMSYGGFPSEGMAGHNGIFIFAKFPADYKVLRFDSKHNQWSAPTVPAYRCAHCAWIPYLGVFIAHSQYQDVTGVGGYQAMTSPDGINWTYTTVPINGYKVIATDDRVYLGANGNWFWSSKDLITWTKHTGLPVSITEKGGVWNGAVALLQGLGLRNYLIRPRGLSTETVPLSEIVSTELIRSGLLQPADFDVTALTAAVRGYRIGRITSIKSALEPLQACFPFDVIQSGYKIKFKQRTGTSVATIPAKDLAARQGE